MSYTAEPLFREMSTLYETPQQVAENLLNREFNADKPNEKWLADVTEFKDENSKEAYLSAILDLHGNTIISYVFGHSNKQSCFRDVGICYSLVAAASCVSLTIHSSYSLHFCSNKIKSTVSLR